MQRMTGLARSHAEFDPKIPGFTPPKVLGFVYDCVIHANPTSCIEIGTYMGRSAFAICTALAHLGENRQLLCVDKYDQKITEDYFSHPIIKAAMERSEPASVAYRDLNQVSDMGNCLNLTLRR